MYRYMHLLTQSYIQSFLMLINLPVLKNLCPKKLRKTPTSPNTQQSPSHAAPVQNIKITSTYQFIFILSLVNCYLKRPRHD